MAPESWGYGWFGVFIYPQSCPETGVDVGVLLWTPLDGSINKKARISRASWMFSDLLGLQYGAQRRNRTTDTGIFNPLLYRLSYLGVLKEARIKPADPGAVKHPVVVVVTLPGARSRRPW